MLSMLCALSLTRAAAAQSASRTASRSSRSLSSSPVALAPVALALLAPRSSRSRADDVPTTFTRTAAFRVTAEPGGILVIRVPLPEEIRSAAARRKTTVTYRVVPGAARVLGRGEGTVAGSDSAVSVTLSISRSAAAGRNAAALVEFTTSAGAALSVPIELDVPAQRNLQLVVPDAFLGGARGNWTNVRFEVANRGNDAEVFSVKTVLPQGWRGATLELPASITLAAGASVRGTVRLWIPAQATLGQAVARIVLLGGGATLATGEVRVDVRDAMSGDMAGPRLTLTAVGATAPDGSTAFGYGASVYGSIADSVTVNARFTYSGAGVGASMYGLARSGIASAPPSLSIESPRVSLAAGAVGTALTELSGFFVNGFGATTRVSRDQLSVHAFAARPYGIAQNALFSAGEGSLAGLRVARRMGRATTSVNGVRMQDAIGAHALNALSLQSEFADSKGGEFTGELGYRQYATGAGTGISGAYRRSVGGSTIDIRAVHAPGGSQAYARAENDLTVSASQQLVKRMSVGGSAWRQRDDNSVIGRMESDGWYVAPSLSLRRIGTTVGLEGRGNRFLSTTPAGRYSNDEQQVGATLDTRRGSAYLSVRSGLGRLSRSINVGSASLPAVTGTRLETRTAIGTSMAGGAFEAAFSSQQFSGPAGLLPEQQAVTARVDHMRVPMVLSLPMFLSADVQRLTSGTGSSPAWSARGGLTMNGPGGLAVTLQAEHNPFLFARGSGGKGLMYTMRVDRVSALPRIISRNQSVFTDMNGNGRRDSGERGVPGVVLECGANSIASDADGRFACPAGYQLVVDARTVPTGLLAPNIQRAIAGADIALRPVIARVVQLTLVEADTFRVRQADLARAIVIARDIAGSAWTARSTGGGAFIFDALPPGRYQIEVDPGDIAEPLRAVNALPAMWVRDDGDTGPLLIDLRPRSVRIKQLGNKADPVSAVKVRATSTRAGSDTTRHGSGAVKGGGMK